MAKTRENIEKELMKIKIMKLNWQYTSENPLIFHQEKLSNEGIKLDKNYNYQIELDNMLFDIDLYEKDGILFHDSYINHLSYFGGVCLFCKKDARSVDECEVLSKYLSEFLSFITRKHVNNRIRMISDPIIQGREILSPEIAFEKMSSLEYNIYDKRYYDPNINYK